MKETIQDLKARRSCRNYQAKQITEEELNTINALSASILRRAFIGEI